MRAGLWVLAAVVAAGPAVADGVADGRWDGLYRIEPEADCDRAGQDGGAIEIADGTFTGVDSSCEMTDPVDVRGMEAQLFTMVCEGEGTAWEERMMVMAAAEGDAVYLLWDGFAFRYEACPPADPAVEDAGGEDADPAAEGGAENEPAGGDGEETAEAETVGG